MVGPAVAVVAAPLVVAAPPLVLVVVAPGRAPSVTWLKGTVTSPSLSFSAASSWPRARACLMDSGICRGGVVERWSRECQH